MALFSSPYNITRSITIDAPVAEVFSFVKDFHTWPEWSPWLIMERSAAGAINGDGKSVGSISAWDGAVIGKGENELLAIEENTALRYELRFQKPFKSMAKAAFTFEAANGGTQVHWHMEGSLPVFLFFMKDMFEQFIKNDYDRGLKMLKARIETGSVPSQLSNDGIVDVPAQHYVGIERTTTIEKMSVEMKEDFTRLVGIVTGQGIGITQKPFTIYKAFDMKNGTAHYISAVPVAPEALAQFADNADVVTGTRAAVTAQKVTHTGPYLYLDNAWTAVFMYPRAAKRKQDKSQHAFEIYQSDPATTPEAEIVTEIFVPVK